MTTTRCRFVRFVVAFFVLAASPFAADAQNVSRGPYLQSGTHEQITIRWRTDTPTDSTVHYGSTAGNLGTAVSASGARTEHEIEVTSLNPDTRYYYSVGDSDGPLVGGTSDFFFATAPAPGVAKPTRIWATGDFGTASSTARNVRDSYKRFAQGGTTDLWLMLGDNAYDDGTDSEYQQKVFDVYPQLLQQVVAWPTLGNHDAHITGATGEYAYFDIFSLPTGDEAGGVASGTENYYAFDYGNIHFVCLDSEDSDQQTMMSWLEDDLMANDKEWLVAFWHHPPYSKGSHDSDSEGSLRRMRQNALPILEDYGVDLVLGGHSHVYERSYLLDGHYGVSSTLTDSMKVDGGDGREGGDGAYAKNPGGTNEGSVYIVAGRSGGRGGSGPLNHPAMFISLETAGSMVIDINGNRLDATYLDSSDGVRDTFTIMKGPDTDPPRISSVVATSATTVSVQFSEPVDVASAELTNNHMIDNGVSIASASVEAAGRSVKLTTSSLSLGIEYTLSVSNVTDLQDNAIVANSQARFSLSSVVTTSFQNSVAPDNSYSGTKDAYISQNAPNDTSGGDADLKADGDDPGGTGQDLASLVRWDISSIPGNVTIESAEITINVLNDSGSSDYELYAVLRDWSEDEVTWERATSGTSWSRAGANGAADRSNTVLGSVGASSTGSFTTRLNSAGLAVVQNWIGGADRNYGFILADAESSNGLDFKSSESTPASTRPRLTITYTTGATTPPPPPDNLSVK